MILKLLLNIRMIWVIFIKILKNRIQIKKHKILIIFDDLTADMLSHKKLNLIVTELYWAAQKNIRLSSAHYFIMKIPKKTRTLTNRI